MINGLIKRLGCAFVIACIAFTLSGQEGTTVSGLIVNSSNEPLGNISVTFEGSREAPAISDSMGHFELLVPSSDVWLEFSPISEYKGKKIYLNRQTDIKVYLLKEGLESDYDEVAYAGESVPRRDLVSSTFSKSGDLLYENAQESFDQDLQGRVAGVHQVGMSGMPGSGTYMLIRGLNSVNSNNSPLVIVDGIPLETPGVMSSVVDGFVNNPLSSIDPQDISTLTLIKDGSSLSSYGVKGSNGIIIIETLKPVETTTSIDFTFKTGVTTMETRMPQLETYNYKTLAKEMLSSSPINEELYQEYYPGLYYTEGDEEFVRYNHNTNWQDEIFHDAWMQNVYLSVKGGDAIARYGLSVGFLNQNGVVKNSNYNRFNTRFVGTFNVFGWLRMYVSANLMSSNSSYNSSALQTETSPLLSALHKSPQLNPLAYDDEGKQLEKIDDIEELGVSNPTAVVNSYYAENTNYRFLTSFKMEGDISKSLKLNILFGLNINDLKEGVFMPNLGMEYYYNNEAYNVSESLNDNLFTMYNDNYLSYQKLFKDIHFLRLSVGVRWQTNDYQEDWGLSMNSNENDQYTNIGTGDPNLEDIAGQNSSWNWLSNYYTASYTFRDKYLLDASFAADFSSRVGKEAEDVLWIGDAPFGLFYNVGVAWRISSESFMSGISAIEDLKLRLSYGTSGNDDIGNQNSFSYYKLKLYRETSGMIPGGIANNYLSYESISQLTAGFELRLMENRFQLSGSYYSSSTDNMLIFEQLDAFMGYDIYPSNNGGMDKTGYELSLFSRIVQKNKFSMDLGISAGHYESTISAMPNNEIITKLPGNAEIINRVGEPANSFYGYEYLGVFSTSDDVLAAGSPVNEKGVAYRAGDAQYNDISGPDGAPDGVINEYDKILLGSATPEYYGGISLDMTYGRWSLGIMFQFVYGNENYNYLRYENEKMTDLSNQSGAVLNRWIYEGQETNIPRSLWDDPIGNSAFSSRWIEDGSYARLKEVTLAYRIPDGFAFFKDLNIFLTGANLFTISNYLGYDPEFSYSFNPQQQGIDYGLMPHGRRIIVGVKFGL